MAQVITQKVVARGLTLDGRTFTISKLGHDQEIPGVGKDAYAVDVAASQTLPAVVSGFASYEDAKRFVSGGKDQYDVFDHNGQRQTIEREGLFVPSAMIAELEKPVRQLNQPNTANQPMEDQAVAPRRADQANPTTVAPVTDVVSDQAAPAETTQPAPDQNVTSDQAAPDVPVDAGTGTDSGETNG